MKIVKIFVKRLTRVIPYNIKIRLLRFLAMLPPRYRLRIGYLYASYLSSFLPPETTFWTNMGISTHYRCQVPAGMDPCVIWGKPEFYIGEHFSMLLASTLSKRVDAFVDVGSYLGYYVFWVKSQIDEHKPIYYFEPIPEYYLLIQKNVLENKLSNVHGSDYALGDQRGTFSFYKNLNHSTCGSLTPRYVNRHQTIEVQVQVTTFTNFFQFENLASLCVKVDVEGAEQLFINGAHDLINKIQFLIIEVLDPKSGFLQIMQERYEYKVYHILPRGILYCPDGMDEYVDGQWNWLLCRFKPSELQDLLYTSGLSILYK